MCKFKEYKHEIEKTRSTVSFRITYFSKPSFLNEFVSERSNYLGDNFAVRQLTDKESEAVDVDTISYLLSIPLDYVLKDNKVYIFNNAIFENCTSRVFISQYFIFIQIKVDEKQVSMTSKELMDFLNLEQYLRDLDIIDFSMIDEYKFGCESSELWNILDKSAFGDIDVEKFVDSRYADKHARGDYEANLVRNIVKREDSNGNELCQVSLKPIVSLSDPEQKSIEFNILSKTLLEMKTICEKEVTRCFSEGL